MAIVLDVTFIKYLGLAALAAILSLSVIQL